MSGESERIFLSHWVSRRFEIISYAIFWYLNDSTPWTLSLVFRFLNHRDPHCPLKIQMIVVNS